MSEIKKNPVGRPAVNATPITVRVPPDMLEALDRLTEALEGCTRPEALRFALRTYMEADGFLEVRERLPMDLLVNLTPSEKQAVIRAFGTDRRDQQEGVEQVVRDWLKSQGHLKR